MRPNVIRLTLNDAESLRAYNLSGRMLTLRSASAPFATVSVSLDDSSGPWITLRRGDRVPVAFDRLYIKWDAQPGQWVELVEGEGWELSPLDMPTIQDSDWLRVKKYSCFSGFVGENTVYVVPNGKTAEVLNWVVSTSNQGGAGGPVKVYDASGTLVYTDKFIDNWPNAGSTSGTDWAQSRQTYLRPIRFILRAGWRVTISPYNASIASTMNLTVLEY